MRRLASLILLLALAAPGWAQGEPTHNYPDGIAAIVEGEPITRHELELACQLRADFRQVGSGERRKAILAHELEEMIKQRVLLKKVKDEGIEFTKNDQARLQWELSRRARDRRGIDGLKEDLASIGVPYDYFVQRQKTNILVGKLLVKTISRDIFITPAEIRRFYLANPERFATKGEIRLRQIVLYPEPSQGYRSDPPGLAEELKAWDAMATAEALRQRAQAGEDFRELAKSTSMGVHWKEDERYDTDTRLGDVLVPPLPQIVSKLEVGQLSEVIESPRGSLHLVMVLSRRPPGVLPLPEVQREIEAALKEQVWRQRLDTWITEQRSKAHVISFLR
jgi:parvulin-like peptidyl-prolyl isomerase